MNPTSLDKQSGAADDGHIVRVARLETQMDNVAGALTSLQRTQENLQRTVEQNHRDTLARFDEMRNRMDTLHQITNERMDRYVRWMMGIMLAHITATAGIIARLFVN